jgi:hypothetical protein
MRINQLSSIAPRPPNSAYVFSSVGKPVATSAFSFALVQQNYSAGGEIVDGVPHPGARWYALQETPSLSYEAYRIFLWRTVRFICA